MTATRPVTTPNLHCAPPCAKPADHHDTPHSDGRLFNAAQKKEQRRDPKRHIAGKDQSPQRERRAMCDVRAESRRLHWARRGRDGPAPQEHGGELGSFFFSSVECTHRPLLRGYHHGHVSRVASLLCAFFRAMLCARAAAGGLRCVHGREAKEHGARRVV